MFLFMCLLALRVLKLQNNRLKSIPYTLADLATLEEIDCSNNEQLGKSVYFFYSQYY